MATTQWQFAWLPHIYKSNKGKSGSSAQPEMNYPSGGFLGLASCIASPSCAVECCGTQRCRGRMRQRIVRAPTREPEFTLRTVRYNSPDAFEGTLRFVSSALKYFVFPTLSGSGYLQDKAGKTKYFRAGLTNLKVPSNAAGELYRTVRSVNSGSRVGALTIRCRILPRQRCVPQHSTAHEGEAIHEASPKNPPEG